MGVTIGRPGWTFFANGRTQWNYLSRLEELEIHRDWSDRIGSERALAFGAEQLLLQHRRHHLL